MGARIVLDDEAAVTQAETLEVPGTTPGQRRGAGRVLCAIAARGFDLTDDTQRAAAVRFARPALQALGLLAEPEDTPAAEPDSDHGSVAGYSAHRRRGEQACEECLVANRAYHRARNGNNAPPLAPCGTETAYKRHRDHRETACEPCRLAHNKYTREKKAAQRAARRAEAVAA